MVQLLDEGNTVPFITRYRKERTGGLDEEGSASSRNARPAPPTGRRKQTILQTIENQGRLTDELRAAIVRADNPKRLEDLYLPYKPKKRTLAGPRRKRPRTARRGDLVPRCRRAGQLDESSASLVNPEKELNTPDEVRRGAAHPGRDDRRDRGHPGGGRACSGTPARLCRPRARSWPRGRASITRIISSSPSRADREIDGGIFVVRRPFE